MKSKIALFFVLAFALTSCTAVRNLRAYQIEVSNDSLYLYQKKKLVATLANTENKSLDSVIIADNQQPY